MIVDDLKTARDLKEALARLHDYAQSHGTIFDNLPIQVMCPDDTGAYSFRPIARIGLIKDKKDNSQQVLLIQVDD